MALVGVELVTLVFEPDAQTTRPPPFAVDFRIRMFIFIAQTKEQSKTRKYAKQMMQNIISVTGSRVKGPIIFESSNSLEWFIKWPKKEHQKEIKPH